MHLARAGRTAVLLGGVLVGATAHGEEALELGLPIDCTVGKSCFIQKYPDAEPGPAARDYACGHLVGDGHTGTDFRITGLKAMARGVAVRASAAGTVRAVRDGMADVDVRQAGRPAVRQRECGNAVVLSHRDGWETQYCHMRKGSVAVRSGEPVAAGAQLGLVGLSGLTQFPHLHFEVRRGEQVVDPFVGLTGSQGCRATRRPLWSKTAGATLGYRPSGLLLAGFHAATVTLDGIERGDYRAEKLPTIAPVLVYWVRISGLLPGDVTEIRLRAPNGKLLASDHSKPAAAAKLQWMRFIGRKRPGTAWPAGAYGGAFELWRDGRLVLFDRRTLLVE